MHGQGNPDQQYRLWERKPTARHGKPGAERLVSVAVRHQIKQTGDGQITSALERMSLQPVLTSLNGQSTENRNSQV